MPSTSTPQTGVYSHRYQLAKSVVIIDVTLSSRARRRNEGKAAGAGFRLDWLVPVCTWREGGRSGI